MNLEKIVTVPNNKKKLQPTPEGGFQLRIYHSKRKVRVSPRFRIKCGCCESEVTICYDKQTLEINGVIASIEEWSKILRPLLDGVVE